MESISNTDIYKYLLSFWREIIGAFEPGSSLAANSAIAAITPELFLDAHPFAGKKSNYQANIGEYEFYCRKPNFFKIYLVFVL